MMKNLVLLSLATAASLSAFAGLEKPVKADLKVVNTESRPVMPAQMAEKMELQKVERFNGVGNIQLSKLDRKVAASAAADEQVAFYAMPMNTLSYGLSTKGYSGMYYQMVHPFSDVKLTNYSTQEKASFLWNAFEGSTDGKTWASYTSSDIDLTYQDVDMTHLYKLPTLSATYNGTTTKYLYGAYYNTSLTSSYLTAFPVLVYDEEDDQYGTWNAGFANIDLKIASRADETYTLFGTGSAVEAQGKKMTSVTAIYPQPENGRYYMFSGFSFLLSSFSAPADAEFTLTISEATFNEQGLISSIDEIGRATATAANVVSAGSFSYLNFSDFVALDEDGFENEIGYIESNKELYFEVSGFNKTGVTMVFSVEGYERPDGLNTAYFKMAGDDDNYSYQSFSTSFYTTMNDAYFSYLVPSVNSITASVEGGNYEFTLQSCFNKFGLDEDVPEWIALTSSEMDNTGLVNLNAAVEAMPAGVEGRTAYLKFATYGAHTTIPVIQGKGSGVSFAKAQVIKAAFNGNVCELSYSEDQTSVEVISANGAKVASYALPAEGKFAMPADALAKGLYILKFNGKVSATVKVVK